MRLTTGPEALPGSCFKCGSANRDFFIDLGMSFEFHGAVYICSECITEMASLSGFVSKEEISQIILDKEHLSEENFILVKRIDGQRKIIDGLRDLGDADRASSNLMFGMDADMESEAAPSGESDLGTGEGEITESSDDERMDLVSADASESSPQFKLF